MTETGSRTVIDLEGWTALNGSGRRPEDADLRVIIDEEAVIISETQVSRGRLLELVAKAELTEITVFKRLSDGQFVEIGHEEVIDLCEPLIESFHVGSRHHEYRFVLDGVDFTWPIRAITGLKLKHLAKVDPATYGVWEEIPGEDDRPIADHQKVHLRREHAERFFTGKKGTTEG